MSVERIIQAAIVRVDIFICATARALRLPLCVVLGIWIFLTLRRMRQRGGETDE